MSGGARGEASKGEGSFENWVAVMDDLLHGLPSEQEMALRKLSRLISGFLGRLRAFDHGDEWDDLRQASVMKLVKSYRKGQLKEAKAFVSYAFTITRNEFYDLLRARRNEEVCELPDLSEEKTLDDASVLAVRTALAKLPDNHRKAIEPVYVQGMSYEEASAATGIPLGSLKRYLRLGMAQLKEELAGLLSLVVCLCTFIWSWS